MSKPKHARVLILGSGPAGYTAAIYAARAMLKPVLITGGPAGRPALPSRPTSRTIRASPTPSRAPGSWSRCRPRPSTSAPRSSWTTSSKVDLKSASDPARGRVRRHYTCDALIICTGAQARWLGIETEEAFKGYGGLRLRHLRRLLLQEARMWSWLAAATPPSRKRSS